MIGRSAGFRISSHRSEPKGGSSDSPTTRRGKGVGVGATNLVSTGREVADDLAAREVKRVDRLLRCFEQVDVVDLSLDTRVDGAGKLPLPRGAWCRPPFRPGGGSGRSPSSEAH